MYVKSFLLFASCLLLLRFCFNVLRDGGFIIKCTCKCGCASCVRGVGPDFTGVDGTVVFYGFFMAFLGFPLRGVLNFIWGGVICGGMLGYRSIFGGIWPSFSEYGSSGRELC